MTQFAKLEKAQALIDMGRYQPAVSILMGCLGERTMLIEVYLRLVICHINLNHLEEAERYVQLGLQEDPNRSEILYLYSFICQLQEKFNPAFQHIEAALRLEPTRVKYLVHLASLYIDKDKYKKALEHLKVAEQYDPEDVDVLTQLANLSIAKGDKKASFHYLERGLALAPNDPTLLALQSKILGQSSTTRKQAEAEAFEALRQDPNDAFAKATLLEILQKKNVFTRFFVARSFNRYNVEWTPVRVIIAVLCWKGVLLWGGFGTLYLMINWYCGVLFNTFLRRHKRYKYLLTEAEIKQSNFFLMMNGILITAILGLNVFGGSVMTSFGVIVGILVSMLFGLSYFAIEFKRGRIQFAIFGGIAGMILALVGMSGGIAFAVFAILILLIYAFCFTLMIGFR